MENNHFIHIFSLLSESAKKNGMLDSEYAVFFVFSVLFLSAGSCKIDVSASFFLYKGVV